jgi:cellulose synthase/poly-beta-1,6-N-acetylglucosamine synthase-like glycosyltransferase
MLSQAVAALLGIMGLVVAFSAVYLLFLLCAAMSALRNARPESDTLSRRFCIIIPAHNEELVLAGTLQSLKESRYPADLYDVVVVADNCTDTTAEIARSFGAVVMERADLSRRGKGYALEWAIQQLLAGSETADAFVIVDADT